MGTLDRIAISSLIDRIHVSIPFQHLAAGLLQVVISKRVRPEIIISHSDLDNFSHSDFIDTAKQLASAALPCTIHAPFLDLRPGGVDPKIRRVSFERLEHCLEIASHFNPIAIICHHAFDEKYYISKKGEWLENSIRFWSDIIELLPQRTRIALENVYETTPQEIKHLLSTINSEKLRFCFDVGHCNCFAKGNYHLWIEEIGAYLTDMHLHDNSGASDEHLAPLDGIFPFANFFTLLSTRGIKARGTVEAGSISILARALKNLEHLEIRNVLA